MKQTITVDQLNQLSDSGKQKLREWWNPEAFDLYVDTKANELTIVLPRMGGLLNGDVPVVIKPDNGLPLLSIGQMIEFLDGEKLDMPYSGKVDFYGVSKTGEENWYVGVDGSDELASTNHVKPELCDALWSACLEVLNK